MQIKYNSQLFYNKDALRNGPISIECGDAERRREALGLLAIDPRGKGY